VKNIIVLLIICLVTDAFGQINNAPRYKPGYYYTRWGTKVVGFLSFSNTPSSDDDKEYKKQYGICSFYFKYTDEKKAKTERFTTRDVSNFVIEGDSFAILKNIEYVPKLRVKAIDQDYVKVVETGKLNLYQYFTAGTSYMGPHPSIGRPEGVEWYLEKDGKAERLLVSDFSTQSEEYFSDYPELFDRIKSGGLDYRIGKDNVQKMVQLYNAHFKK